MILRKLICFGIFIYMNLNFMGILHANAGNKISQSENIYEVKHCVTSNDFQNCNCQNNGELARFSYDSEKNSITEKVFSQKQSKSPYYALFKNCFFLDEKNWKCESSEKTSGNVEIIKELFTDDEIIFNRSTYINLISRAPSFLYFCFTKKQ